LTLIILGEEYKLGSSSLCSFASFINIHLSYPLIFQIHWFSANQAETDYNVRHLYTNKIYRSIEENLTFRLNWVMVVVVVIFNSIQFLITYLRANLTAQRPNTKRARVRKNKQKQNFYKLQNNNNNNNNNYNNNFSFNCENIVTFIDIWSCYCPTVCKH
jgi:hypothetical protein